MPEPDLTLDPDQADDLRELIDLTAILQEWLQHADDSILDDLASFAYRDTIHPRSCVDWLTDDLAGISARLRTATNSSCNTLDTPAPIGNQIPPSRRRSEGPSGPGRGKCPLWELPVPMSGAGQRVVGVDDREAHARPLFPNATNLLGPNVRPGR